MRPYTFLSRQVSLVAIHVCLSFICTFKIYTQTPEVRLLSGTNYALPAGASSPRSMAMSPNGKYLAIGNYNSDNVTIMKVGVGGVLSGGINYVLPSGATQPNSVVFSPDGNYLAIANKNSTNITVHVESGGVLSNGINYAPPAGSTNISTVAFSPNGKFLALANFNYITIFQANAGILSNPINYGLPSVFSAGPNDIKFSSDGAYLATPNLMDTTIFHVETDGTLSNGASYILFNSTTPSSIAFSPNGAYLAVGNLESANVVLFQIEQQGILSGATAYDLPAGAAAGFIRALTFSPDSSCLFTANEANGVSLFKVGTGGVLIPDQTYDSPTGSSNPYAIVFFPDNAYIAVANAVSTDVTIFKLGHVTDYPLPSSSSTPRSLAFSPDGLKLVVANSSSNDVTLFALDKSTGIISLSPGISYPLPSGSLNPSSITFSSDSKYVGVCNAQSNDVTIFTVIGNTLSSGISYPHPPVLQIPAQSDSHQITSTLL